MEFNTEKEKSRQRKAIGKAYNQYVKQFTPSPNYGKNGLRAFLVGGSICTAALWVENGLVKGGMTEADAGAFTTMGLIAAAQLLTGLGVFDVLAKFAGAGVIVPITGFANSMVAPAIEYKKEGPVLGAGAKMFSVAGPVLVSGITAASLLGIICWIAAAIQGVLE